jgi:hypothetical protein
MTTERELLYARKKQWRENRSEPMLAIEVHGPDRDYDFSVFCVDHNTEAEECAAEWSANIIDGLEAGQESVLRMSVRKWIEGEDSCCICNPTERDA